MSVKQLWVGLILLLIPVVVCGNDLSVTYTDSIAVADTGTVRRDTVFTPKVEIKTRFLQFGCKLSALQHWEDTNWGNDTFFVKAQTSFDGTNWITVEIDTLLDNGYGTSGKILDRDADVFGNYLRGVLIHVDSLGNTAIDSAWLADHPYSFRKKFELFYSETR